MRDLSFPPSYYRNPGDPVPGFSVVWIWCCGNVVVYAPSRLLLIWVCVVSSYSRPLPAHKSFSRPRDPYDGLAEPCDERLSGGWLNLGVAFRETIFFSSANFVCFASQWFPRDSGTFPVFFKNVAGNSPVFHFSFLVVFRAIPHVFAQRSQHFLWRTRNFSRAQVNRRNSKGETALMHAAASHSLKIVRMLMQVRIV